jgi:type I restriction enzyme S subunit
MQANKWNFTKLEDLITDIKNGFASGKRDQNGIVQIRMNNVTVDGKLTFEKYLKVPVPQTIKEFQLRKGDFLFNNTNSIDLVGKSTIFISAPFPCTFSNHFTRIRFDEKRVDSKFVFYHFLLLWMKGSFKSVAIRHVGQAAVQKRYIQQIKIPLPPLPEQKKIAEILSTVDLAIEKIDKAIIQTDKLKLGLMKKLLTKGTEKNEMKITSFGKIPISWQIKKIQTLGRINTGKTPPTKISEYWNGNIPFITPGDIKGNRYITGTDRYITLEGSKKAGKILPKDTVLVVCIGSTIGKIGMTYTTSVANQQINSIICNKLTFPNFLYSMLSLKEKMIKSFSGTAAVPIINKSLFQNLKIPLPPLYEQIKISNFLIYFDHKLVLLNKKKEILKKIKKGFMNDLLTGRKRVRMES